MVFCIYKHHTRIKMIVNSFQFVFFVLCILFLYYILPFKSRNLFLLVASYYFYYSFIPQYIFLLFFSTIISYGIAIFIEKLDSKRYKKLVLFIGILLFTLILFIFKYYNFFIETYSLLGLKFHMPKVSVLVPVGISFYTFSIISYLVDVFMNKTIAEKKFVDYALYISFFPKIICGPIEKLEHLIPQFKYSHDFNYRKTIEGGKQVLWGLFKKIAIADILAIYIDAVWNDIYSYKGLVLLTATFLYSTQIYCDFSGYSDVAIGVSKMLGFELKKNFDKPYMAQSLKDFWNQWHISLNAWLRDYIYFPLGGGRAGRLRKYYNIMIVFLVSGIWHGADITYILWGGLHGIFRVIEDCLIGFNRKKYKVYSFIKRFYTYILVTLIWVLFRADSIQGASYMYKNIFVNISISTFISASRQLIYNTVFESNSFFIVYIIWIVLAVAYLFINDSKNRIMKKSEYYIMAIATCFWLVFQNGTWGQTGNFIYFNF